MAADRQVRILALLAEQVGGSESRRLCAVAARVTGMSGAGIMLLDATGPHGSLCTTDDTSRRIEDLQYTLGEGPCVDAHRSGRVTVEPDLGHPAVARWAAFTPPAVAAGVRAVFGFPVRVGAARLGALNLYRDTPGMLTDDEHADGLVMADVAARAVLALQGIAAPGEMAAEFEVEADFHLIVHQAAGMVSIQLHVSVAEALVRLRAHAFSTGLPINRVAASVVSRDLRFSDGP